MMSDQIPVEDHVSRYCGGSHIDDGRVDGSAFMLRQDEKALSVNWLEFLRLSTRVAEIDAVRQIFSEKGRSLGSTAVFAVLNVGKLIEHVMNEGETILEVFHDPQDDDPCHSGISGYGPDDDIVADLIAEAVTETHPAISN